MKKWVCPVCGYVHEGENPPAECPVCHVSGDKFTLQAEEKTWAAEHVVGVGKVFGEDVPAEVREEIIAGLRANFEGECSEVGMYLAMARVAHREGYPEIGMYWEKAGLEEAEHAAKFAELLGEVVTDSTQKNLQMRVDAENGATAGKFELAKLAKKYRGEADFSASPLFLKSFIYLIPHGSSYSPPLAPQHSVFPFPCDAVSVCWFSFDVFSVFCPCE